MLVWVKVTEGDANPKQLCSFCHRKLLIKYLEENHCFAFSRNHRFSLTRTSSRDLTCSASLSTLVIWQRLKFPPIVRSSFPKITMQLETLEQPWHMNYQSPQNAVLTFVMENIQTWPLAGLAWWQNQAREEVSRVPYRQIVLPSSTAATHWQIS